MVASSTHSRLFGRELYVGTVDCVRCAQLLGRRKTIMRTALCSLLLALCALQPALAAYPVITTSINSSSGGVTYTYALTNESVTAEVVDFTVYVPDSVLHAITFVGGPTNYWTANVNSRNGGHVYYGVATGASGIRPGESGSFSLVTTADVPIGYNYAPLGNTNWAWTDKGGGGLGGGHGNTVLPVPVPEPSSILALAGGIAGLGGLVLRRRKG